jgi:hypothetical protein
MAVRANIRMTSRPSPGWRQKKAMRTKQGHRALRMIVWASRSVGWVMLVLAALNALQPGAVHLANGFRVASSLALASLGVVWIVGVEVFLHFFDRFLSRN